MFWKRKRPNRISFDKTGKIPVIRSSICTGEQTAGFRDTASGKFEEVMLLRSDADLQEFLRLYGVDAADVKKEW
ncbi:MAG: aspartate dehydrogenase [Oscillospiraceae bacterium]|nr:aspartate dehydrogenase [Oscillospiraceae bacterium]